MAWEKQIEEMDFEGLKLWLLKVLNDGNPFPMPTIDQTVPYEYAERAYKNISRPDFRVRMDRAIGDLFTKFSLEISNSMPELLYFANLSYLIARLKVVEAKKELLVKINTGHFINQPPNKFSLPFVAPDLQFLLLKVLIEFRDFDTVETFFRFFSNEEGLYSHICYRGLWECDRQYGIRYLPELVRIYNRQQEKPFNFVLEFGFFLEKHFLFFLEEYDKVFPNLPVNKLDREVKDLVIRGAEEFMRQSELDIMPDDLNQELVSIVHEVPGNNTPPKTVFKVSYTSPTRALVMSKYLSPNQIIPHSAFPEQVCDPNKMPCYKIAPVPLTVEVYHD